MLIELMGSMDFLSLEEKTLKGWNHMFYSEDMAVNLAKCSLEPIQMVEYGWIWGTSESNLHMDILKRCLETALHIPKVANEHDKRRVSTSLGFAQKTAYCRTLNPMLSNLICPSTGATLIILGEYQFSNMQIYWRTDTWIWSSNMYNIIIYICIISLI